MSLIGLPGSSKAVIGLQDRRNVEKNTKKNMFPEIINIVIVKQQFEIDEKRTLKATEHDR
jgi:hypothetical protein